jgi:hypothetical protein
LPKPFGYISLAHSRAPRTLTVADEWMTGNEAILMYEPLLKERSDA